MKGQEQVYRVSGTWTGDIHGQGTIKIVRLTLKTDFAIPKSFGGPGGLTNPEEIFLASACSCYLITLAMIAEKMHLPVKKLTCTAEGVVSADQYDGYHFKEIHLQPHIELEGDQDAHDEAIARAVKLAEQRCIISRAVKGSVKYDIRHTVAV